MSLFLNKVYYKKDTDGNCSFCLRLLVVILIFSLIIPPLPMAGQAAMGDSEADAARVHARLNSPERRAAIEEARRVDAAAREAFAEGEKETRVIPFSPLAKDSTPVLPVPSAAQSGSDGQALENAHLAREQIQESNATSHGVKGRRSLASDGVAYSERPKSMTEVMFNAATGMMGVPGLAGSQYDPYDSNADQGLGFHADGTSRRADGSTGSSAGYDGRRAASYAGHGASHGPVTGLGASSDDLYANDLVYNPLSGWSSRNSDPVRGGKRTYGQGAYGSLDDFDPARLVLDRGLNYGLGLANSAAEGLFGGLMESPYGGARARFNFRADWDGKVNGEGDLLLPWYDSKYSTVYSQFGARSMNADAGRDRWIGNFGLGQRWYPQAVADGTDEDAGNLMLGYNAFFDYDFTRKHQRGGAGLEAQYDWLHLASNYYAPLSAWKDSKDFDSKYVKERPAEGWDLRAKGYLPFYRNLAVTGAYTQWYGDHVGMFGANNLEKDPKVWSYGLEYTPVPLVSGFVNQRSSERGRSDTEFGLRFTYDFAMPWEDQIKHDKVSQQRSVGGSRHEFVDRENKIILEYKSKHGPYIIEYLGKVSTNLFKFRVRDGFGRNAVGKQVRASIGGGATLAEAPLSPASSSFFAGVGEFLSDIFSVKAAQAADFIRTYITDQNGEFLVRVDNVTVTPLVLTASVGEGSQSVSVDVVLEELTLSGKLTAEDGEILNGADTLLTFTGPPGMEVVWTVVSGPGVLSNQQGVTDDSGIATATLTAAATGSGPIVVKAVVDGKEYTVTVNITVMSVALSAADSTLSSNGVTTLTLTSNLPQGTAVVWTVLSGPGVLSGEQVVTDASGLATATLTANATGSGSIVVQATVGGVDYTVTVEVISSATLSAADSSLLNAASTLLTFASNLPQNTAVAWSVVSGPGTLSAQQNVTDSAGSATATLTADSIGSGDIVVQATVDGTNYTVTINVAASGALASDDPTLVNTGFTMLRLTGNQAGTPVTWAVLSGPGTLSAQTNTDSAGDATATLTAAATGNGPIVVQATVNGTAYQVTVTVAAVAPILTAAVSNIANNGTTLLTFASNLPQNTAVSWTVGSGPGTLSGQQTNTDSSGTATATLTAAATGNGNIVVRATINGANYQVTVTVAAVTPTLSAASPSLTNTSTTLLTFASNLPQNTAVAWTVVSGPGTLSGQQVNTDVSGGATATLTAAATGNGPIVVQATVNGTPYQVTVTVTAVTPTLTSAASSLGNGGMTLLTFASNLPQNTAVSWSVSGPGSLFSSQPSIDAFGTATATLTADATGNGNIVITATVNGTAYQVTVAVAAVAPTLTAASLSLSNGGTTQLTFTSNLAQNTAISWSVVSGPGTLSGQQVNTGATGGATATLTVAGTGNGPIVLQALVNGTAYQVTVTVAAVTPTLAAAASSLTNNGTTLLTFASNLAQNTAVSWSVVSGPGTLSGQQINTDASGQATATLTVAATGNGPIVLQALVNGTAYQVTVTVAAVTPTLAAAASSLTNNGTTLLTFASNLAQNTAVSWSVVSGPGTLSGQQNNTDATGGATATLTAAATGNGPIVLQALVNGTPYQVTVTVAAVTPTLSATASSLTNNGTTLLTFASNLAQNTAVSWSVVSGPGTLSGQQVNTDATGQATATLTAAAVGNGSIVLQALVNGTAYQVTVTVAVTTPVLSASPSSGLVNGGTSALTLTSNYAPGATVIWSVVSGPGTVSGGAVTNASGGSAATLTVNATGNGNIVLQATVDGTASNTVTVNVPLVLTLTPDNSAQTYPVGSMRNNESFTLDANGIPLTAGTTVSLGYSGTGLFDSPPATATVGSGGKISLDLKGLTAGAVTMTATVGAASASCALAVTNAYAIVIDSHANGPGFSSSSTAGVTAKVTNGDNLLNSVTVTWSVLSADNSANAAVTSAYASKRTGLAWGTTATSLATYNPPELTATTTSNTNASGLASVNLTDIVGQRNVTIQATVTLGGTNYNSTQVVTFGAGPLQGFRVPGGSVGFVTWANAATIAGSTSFPAAAMCGGNGSPSWGIGDYSAITKLPSWAQFKALHDSGYGAYYAAGWPNLSSVPGNTNRYHVGEILGSSSVGFVNMLASSSMFSGPAPPNSPLNVVCHD